MAFELLQLRAVPCTIYDALGFPAQVPDLPEGLRIAHWVAVREANAWFRYARRLALDPERMRAAASGTGWAASDYVAAIGKAIMQGYNALNIVWYNDPDARRLFRERFAGLPYAPAGTQYAGAGNVAEFGKLRNYNDDWYKPNEEFPVGKDFTGQVPAEARAAFLRLYPRQDLAARHPNQVVLPVLPVIIPANAQHLDTDPPGILTYEFEGTDHKFAMGAFHGSQAMGGVFGGLVGAPDNENTLPGIRDWQNAFPDRVALGEGQWGALGDYYDASSGQRTGGVASILDEATGARRAMPGWNSVGFDVATPMPFGGEFDATKPLKLAPPLRAVYGWLRDWAIMMDDRNPLSVVVCSRVYTAWRNAQVAKTLGDNPTTWFDEVSSTASDVMRQIQGESAVANTVAGLATAIGAGVSAALPMTGGIPALIGGAISTVTLVANKSGMFSSGVQNRGRDDLGRYKPQFERGWLSGDPTDPTGAGRPAFQVDLPPSDEELLVIPVDNPAALLARDAVRGAPYVGPYQPPPPDPPSKTATASGAKGSAGVLVAGGLLAAGGLALYAISQRSGRGR